MDGRQLLHSSPRYWRCAGGTTKTDWADGDLFLIEAGRSKTGPKSGGLSEFGRIDFSRNCSARQDMRANAPSPSFFSTQTLARNQTSQMTES